MDQPAGTGYSLVDPENHVETESRVAENMFEFLTKFLHEFPEFIGRDFYIAGESYAGKYVPNIASYLNKQLFSRATKGTFGIQFKGFSIGNGMINPWVQYESYAPYAYSHNLINYETYIQTYLSLRECETMMKFNIKFGTQYCENIYGQIVSFDPTKKIHYSQVGTTTTSQRFNNFDITKPCIGPLCYDFSYIDRFMNLSSVKMDLGVPKGQVWYDCNGLVGEYMAEKDWRKNAAPLFTELLGSGLKVLLYHGDLDLICNWMGGVSAAESFDWWGKEGFRDSSSQNVGYGLRREFGNLSFVKVSMAGHMVPMDQPENAAKMLKWFIGKQEVRGQAGDEG